MPGAPDPEGFVVGKVLSVEKHPDAERLSVCEVDAGDGGRTIVCGAPNVAAGQTVPVALPGAVMPDGTKLGKAKLRGVESNGMILSEAELEIGDDAAGIAVLDEDGRLRERRWRGDPGLRPGDRARADLQPGRLLRRLRRRPRGARDHRRRAGDGALGRGRRGHRRGDGRRLRLGHGRGPGALPAIQRARLHRRPDRALAALAQGAADRRGDAPDQQRRRHHELRDADDGPAAARLRPRQGPRRRADRPDGEAGREDDDARRRRADLRRGRGPGLRPQRALGHRRDHGRRGLGGLRDDHARAARGRDLERGQHPADLAEARAAHRRVEPVREAASPGARAPRTADRLPADGRALRGEAGAGDDRRRPPDVPEPHRLRLRHDGSSACSGWRSRRISAPSTSSGSNSRSTRDGDDLEATVPVPPPLRRHPGGRPDRGGRPDPRLREEPSLDPALHERPGRPADPGAAPAPPGRGRDARSRLRCGRRPQPHRPGHAGQAPDPRGRRPLRADPRLKPALRRALGRADGAGRLPARCCELQPRARRGAGGAVRVRPRLPARGGLGRRTASSPASSPASVPRPPTSRGASHPLPREPFARGPGAASRPSRTSTQ